MTETVVETRYGKVKGERNGEVSVWKGIPYAKPPTGTLRFRPPQPPEAWSGIRDATEFGPTAMQPSREIMNFLGDAPTNSSEDCLYLNIWSPAADDNRRPVMVWIHGGAFMNGSGSSPSYNGTSFAQEGDVVVVTINYRLGVFGFLHLGDVGGEKYAASGNCGILDQIAALKWVQENIAAFGGDPNRVTIFGESAGAMSVGILLANANAKGLFSQAILQSGAAKNVLSPEFATKITNRLLSNLDLSTNDLETLQEMPAHKLLEAASDIASMSLGPVIDGVAIPEHPYSALAEGAAKDIPILIGTTEHEYRLFTFFDPTWKGLDENEIENRFEQAFKPIWPALSKELKGKLSQDLFEKMMTFQVFTYPAIELSEMQLKQGTPVWMYRFDFKSTALGGGLKACHALEIPFVWNSLTNPKTENFTGDSPDRFNIAKQMHHAWIAFAHNGNPNTPELPHWPNYDTEQRATMLFNITSQVENDPAKEERLLFQKITAKPV